MVLQPFLPSSDIRYRFGGGYDWRESLATVGSFYGLAHTLYVFFASLACVLASWCRVDSLRSASVGYDRFFLVVFRFGFFDFSLCAGGGVLLWLGLSRLWSWR